MLIRRSQRAPKPVTIWEEKKAPSAGSDPKLTAQTARNRPETALKPLPTGPLPESTKFDHDRLPELSIYHPPLDLRRKPSESIATGLSILQTFQLFFPQALVDMIIFATNAYANRRRQNRQERKYTRNWKFVNSTDIWRYIGCLLYMGEKAEAEHA
jgi:Transposase IS4